MAVHRRAEARVIPEDTRAKMAELYQKHGLTMPTIAQRYGCNVKTVGIILKEKGVVAQMGRKP